jgi:hypothetical protein
LSVRAVSERLKLSKTTVSTYLLRAREAGLSMWPLPAVLDDEQFLERPFVREFLKPVPVSGQNRAQFSSGNFESPKFRGSYFLAMSWIMHSVIARFFERAPRRAGPRKTGFSGCFEPILIHAS